MLWDFVTRYLNCFRIPVYQPRIVAIVFAICMVTDQSLISYQRNKPMAGANESRVRDWSNPRYSNSTPCDRVVQYEIPYDWMGGMMIIWSWQMGGGERFRDCAQNGQLLAYKRRKHWQAEFWRARCDSRWLSMELGSSEIVSQHWSCYGRVASIMNVVWMSPIAGDTARWQCVYTSVCNEWISNLKFHDVW